MAQPTYSRILPLAIAACCGALVVAAVFRGGRWPWRSDTAACLAGPASDPLLKTFRTYACPQCRQGIGWGSDVCSWCGWDRLRFMTPVVLPPASPGGVAPQREIGVEPNVMPNVTPVANVAAPDVAPAALAAPSALLSPRDQNAAGKEFIEGHWLGLEVIPLTPELATEYQVPKGESGILVDEITLEAAESGILAGDMVQSVEGRPTPDLKAFFVATQRVQENERANVGVSRRGQTMTYFMEARNTTVLGFAQMEAAQPIRPGALSPHRTRSKACTECHIIMKTGGQLPTDAGDILPSPPPITRAAVATHGDRGPCVTCHVIR